MPRDFQSNNRPPIHDRLSIVDKRGSASSSGGSASGSGGSGRGHGGGGKRRHLSHGHRRLDDDDAQMADSSLSSLSHKHKSSAKPYHDSRRSSSPTHCVRVELRNWDNVDENNLISWLKRKSKSPIVILNTRSSGNYLSLYVPEEEMVHSLLKLNGYTFGDRKVTITSSSASSTSHGSSHHIQPDLTKPDIELFLQNFVKTRYAETNNLLDLSQLHSIAQLTEKVILWNTNAWKAILKAASIICPNVETISLNQNQLRTLYPLNNLPDLLPSIINISLAENEISDARSIVQILASNPKLKFHLRELVFIGNPVVSPDDQMKNKEYRSRIIAAFPSLQFLDTIPVERNVFSSESTPSSPTGTLSHVETVETLPIQPQQSFYDSMETKGAVEGFLTRFIHLFDTDKSSLIYAYSPSAIFSLMINPHSPYATKNDSSSDSRSSRIRKSHSNESQSTQQYWSVNNLDFSLSRPHKDRDGILLRSTNNLSGADKIISHLKLHMPATQHRNPNSYLIDAWQVQIPNHSPLLYMNVHGIFAEVQSKLDRYFDRCFIIKPSAPGSAAQMNGWPVEIINDVLIIKSSPSDETMKRLGKHSKYVEKITRLDSIHLLPARSGTEPPRNPNGNLSVEQQQKAMEFSRLTGLNLEFSCLCLNEQGWDMQKANAVFLQAKAENRIPPHAF